ncbi:hypothetical protein HanRHA438_Chr17g0838101 [Helianthus annuus]|nr:hypothetical protein HanRHA438_Chr17g0838101 [Helianthus annuus]
MASVGNEPFGDTSGGEDGVGGCVVGLGVLELGVGPLLCKEGWAGPCIGGVAAIWVSGVVGGWVECGWCVVG